MDQPMMISLLVVFITFLVIVVRFVFYVNSIEDRLYELAESLGYEYKIGKPNKSWIKVEYDPDYDRRKQNGN